MNQIHPDATLVELLKRMMDSSVHIHVFVVDVTPSLATVLTDLNSGAIGSATVARSDFTTAGVVAHRGTIIAPPVAIFNPDSGSRTAYGYYITDTTDAFLLACARFDTPVPLAGVTAFVLVTPVMGDQSLFAA